MGETVTLGADAANVDVAIFVDQAVGSDGDSQAEGPYTVELFSDSVGPGGAQATVWETWTAPGRGERIRKDVEVVAGGYIYIKVTEKSGKDNRVGDGRPVKMNDSVWSSPIWFEWSEE